MREMLRNMDELSKKAYLNGGSRPIAYKFKYDDADVWDVTRNPPYKLARTIKFRMIDDLTRTDIWSYLYHSGMKLKKLSSREAVIYANKNTEKEFRNVRKKARIC